MTILHSARLRFEPMSEAHYDGLRVLNADPEVMRYITGQPETAEETRASIARVSARWETQGYSWWSLIEQETGELVGAGCIQHLGHDAANPHEIGWRLRPDRWGRGYAIEAARRMAGFAFDDLQAPLLCAICDPANTASARVMEKLGMRFQGKEVWHGELNLVYRIERAAWQAQSDVARA
jgi:RimJ/RimL family protein N-acetyltransferase